MAVRCKDCGETVDTSYNKARLKGWAITDSKNCRCPDCRTERLFEPSQVVNCKIPTRVVKLLDATGRPRSETIRAALEAWFFEE